MNDTQFNLYDYVAASRCWDQLWADDQVAYWFVSLREDCQLSDYAKDYEYELFESVPSVYGISTARSYYCKDLTQDMNKWHQLIKEHKEYKL